LIHYVPEEVKEKQTKSDICEFRTNIEWFNVGVIHGKMNKSVADGIEETERIILDILHALGVDKHVVVKFDPGAHDTPLRARITISLPLRNEWGKEKENEFLRNFYEIAMEEFAKERSKPGSELLDAELTAVSEAVHCLAEAYDFDALFIVAHEPSKQNLDTYKWTMIMVKKS